MSRKRCIRRFYQPLPPPGLRPLLKPDQVRDLALVHINHLDLIACGVSTEEVLWQWIGGALTWHYVADKLQRRSPARYAEAAAAMRDQLGVLTSVVDRYRRTGSIRFAGLEYQQAKYACQWMDALAEVVDQATAVEAAEWSDRRVNDMAAGCKQEHMA
jgi:hypothetical protein